MMTNKKSHIEGKTVKIPETYTIGIYEGSSPFDLSPSSNCSNPVISRSIFDTTKVNFVADPFAVFENNMWYLFFEIMGMNTRKGILAVTTSSDLKEWSDPVHILEEPFHLSYPQILRHGSDFYMVPESFQSGQIRLYKAVNFPYEWKFEKNLLDIESVDSTLFYRNNLWWMYVCDRPHHHDRLRLYYADDLYGTWQEHPESPILEKDNQISRPAGKMLNWNGRLYRFAQNCQPFYGHSVNAMEVTQLTKEKYNENPIETNPIIGSGEEKWNRVSMHHLDAHQISEKHWIAFVDGRSN